MKVLLVEDDPDQLSLRSLLLQRSGFECFGASAPEAAMEIASRQALDCAILDLRLPTESAGLDLIRQLRASDAQLWIVILSGADPRRFKKLPEALLVNGLLAKPVRSADMIASLKEIPLRSFDARA
ncbi:MAG: response regulator [Bryobacteraceae bacterium]